MFMRKIASRCSKEKNLFTRLKLKQKNMNPARRKQSESYCKQRHAPGTNTRSIVFFFGPLVFSFLTVEKLELKQPRV